VSATSPATRRASGSAAGNDGDLLHGVRVLELADSVAGAVTGMFLADFGADVILVESADRGRARRREPGFAMWDRGKRSVRIEPAAHDEGSRWLAAAMAGADVCLLGPNQQLADWGDAVAAAAAGNGQLVATELPAYLAAGAPWLGGEESEGLLSAHAGVSWRQASQDGGPVEFVLPYLTHIQGIWATACVLAALLERQRSGHGQRITVTGINAVMEASSYNLAVSPDAPDLDTAVGVLGRHPTYRPVRAADGWLACGALGPKFERQVLEMLGLAEILDDPRLAGHTTNMVLPDNVAWVMERVSTAFRSQSREHWLAQLAARGVPAGPVLDRDEWLDHPQVVANGLRAEVDDPDRGPVVMPGVPLLLLRTPGRVQGPAPSLGQHDGVAPWPPRPRPPTPSPPVAAGPLQGLRVLDMGTFVATPYAGFLLAELGADVVKVEPLGGDPFRAAGFVFNRGMRSLAIDLGSEPGRALLRRVCAGADAVLDGMRPGVMTALGLDYDSLRRDNPDICTVSLSAYGTDGPLAGSGGVDMVVQAMSGMMLAQGEPERPVCTTVAVVDVTAAAVCALGVIAAVLHRERTGGGQPASASLVATSTLLGSGALVRCPGRSPAVQGRVDFRGPAPLDRYYQVADGWIRVQSRTPGLAVDQALAGRSAACPDNQSSAGAESNPAAGVERAAAVLAGLNGDEAVALFEAAGVPAVRARKVSEVVRDSQLRTAEFVHLRAATDGSVFATTGRHATFSRTQRSGPLTPPGIGEHSEAVLTEAGLTCSEVAAARAGGIVGQGEPVPMRLQAVYR
jgi:crotonobetainyl-CoA:carnitine CoA-transferase CaiB-like acyl-CoA transferase